MNIWQQSHRAGPAIWSAYRSHLRRHILPRLGHLPLSSIRRHHIKALVLELTANLSDRSAADVLMVLSLVLTEAVHDRRVPVNPASGVKVAVGPAPNAPTPPRSRSPPSSPGSPRDQIMVITAAYTGLRWGELTGLDGGR